MIGRIVHVNDRIDGAVYIGRAMPRQGLRASVFANAYRIGRDGDRAAVLAYYEDDLYTFAHRPSDVLHLLPELRGKPLACWCRHDGEVVTPENRCHGDLLLEALARFTDDDLRSMAGPVKPHRYRGECPGHYSVNLADITP
jgi:hypothetical protein